MLSANILLVDKNLTFYENAVAAFSEIGIESTLSLATNIEESWDLLAGDRKILPQPKIIMIDINEEGINGIELIEKIRQNQDLKAMLVFVLTEVDVIEIKDAAFNLNIAGYMHKPVREEDFVSFFSTLNAYWNSIEFSR